jgi:hypothetical protein
MSRPLIFKLLSFGLVIPALLAEEPLEAISKDVWSTQVYRINFADAINGVAVRCPKDNASDGVKLAFLNQSNEAVKTMVKRWDVPMPEGTLFALDTASATLAVRANEETQDYFTALEYEQGRHLDRNVLCRVDVFEAEQSVLLALAKEYQRRADYTDAVTKLEALVDQGKASLLTTMRAGTVGGRQARTTSGITHSFVPEYLLDQDFRNHISLRTVEIPEVEFTFEPLVDEQSAHAYIVSQFSFDFASPTLTWIHHFGEKPDSVKAYIHHTAAINANMYVRKGTTQMIGMWMAEQTNAQAIPRMQAAFLQTELLRRLPALNPRVERVLRALGDKISVQPKPMENLKEVPPGMSVRTYSYLSLPCGPCHTTTDDDVRDKILPEKLAVPVPILKAAGMEFPTGAWAQINRSSMTMTLQTTEEMFVCMDALMGIVCFFHNPLTVSARIFEADAELIRNLEKDSSRETDHTAALRTLETAVGQGKARIVCAPFVCTKGGQHAECFVGDRVPEMVIEKNELPPAKVKEGATGSQETKPQPSVIDAAFPFKAVVKENKIGLRLEVDTILGEDNITVDLAQSLTYDYAPPTFNEPLVAGESLLLHRVHVANHFTLHVGQPRLVAIWKPDVGADGLPTDKLLVYFITVDVPEPDGP